MPDKSLACVDCKSPFVFTERDQAFFAKMKFSEPKRCKSCRTAKKASRESRGQADPMQRDE